MRSRPRSPPRRAPSRARTDAEVSPWVLDGPRLGARAGKVEPIGSDRRKWRAAASYQGGRHRNRRSRVIAIVAAIVVDDFAAPRIGGEARRRSGGKPAARKAATDSGGVPGARTPPRTSGRSGTLRAGTLSFVRRSVEGRRDGACLERRDEDGDPSSRRRTARPGRRGARRVAASARGRGRCASPRGPQHRRAEVEVRVASDARNGGRPLDGRVPLPPASRASPSFAVSPPPSGFAWSSFPPPSSAASLRRGAHSPWLRTRRRRARASRAPTPSAPPCRRFPPSRA